MTRVEMVFLIARRMLVRELPLIEGIYKWDPREINHIAVWDSTDDPFKRSDYVRKAHTYLREIEPLFWSQVQVSMNCVKFSFDIEVNTGCCECLARVGLPPEKLKNQNIRECQRCGGEI